MIESVNSSIWHPYTQMKLASHPIHIESGKDAVLFAKDGKQYIDAISSWWVNIHGHANEYIARRIAEQALKLEHVIFAGFTHTPAIELANKLLAILPLSFTKIFFSDDGSTSVEAALKMALQYWKNQGVKDKKRIIAFENAYHGDTFGSMSVSAKSSFNAAFEEHLFHVDFIPTPQELNFESVKKLLIEISDSGHVAAFIFEPLVQGAGGMLMHKAEYLDELIRIAREKNIICIADEVMTGFGRTGKTLASDFLTSHPDIICLSKGITGGFMPLGVTACSQKIFDAFLSTDVNKTFFHGHSYTANPLACEAACANLELLLGTDCQSRIASIANSHTQFAGKIKSDKMVKEVRQQGTIIALELKTPEDTSYFNSIRNEVYEFCLERGVLLRPLGNVVYIMPPYCITSSELEKVYRVIADLLNYLKTKYLKE